MRNFYILLKNKYLINNKSSVIQITHRVPKWILRSNIGSSKDFYSAVTTRSRNTMHYVWNGKQLPHIIYMYRQIFRLTATTLPHTNKIYVHRSFTPKCCFIFHCSCSPFFTSFLNSQRFLSPVYLLSLPISSTFIHPQFSF